MIFNSLGSNYNFSFAMKALFGGGNNADQVKLEKYLAEKYSGKAALLYKGREAIALALRLLNLPKGSAVAINGYTCYAVYQPIVEAGLKVEYLDIEENSLHFSAQGLHRAVENNPQIKVVIIQNTLGYACDIEGIAEVCKQKNIILIEDLAHSAGTICKNGREAGSFGDFVVLSFGQDKIIDAVSGGALIIKNKKYQDVSGNKFFPVALKQRLVDRFYPNFTWKIRTNYAVGVGRVDHWILKKLGWLAKPMGDKEKIVLHSLPGWYCRLVLSRFKNLPAEITHREKIAGIYSGSLDKKLLLPNLQVSKSTNLRFPILVKDRQALISHLKTQGIHVSDIWYDAPIAPKKWTAYTDYKGQCREAEKISQMMLNLPTHINVSEKQAVKISSEINLWLK